MFKTMFKILPHICVMLSIALAVIIYVDGRNPLMMFLTSTPSKIFLIVFIAAVFLLSVLTLIRSFYEE